MRRGCVRFVPGPVWSRGCWLKLTCPRVCPVTGGLYVTEGGYTGSSVSTTTVPGALALPLVERPGHLVLVVLGGVPRIDSDEVAPAGVVRGRVPRALRELVRAVVRARRVVRLVVALALDPACAHEKRIVVVGVLTGLGHVVGRRCGSTTHRGSGPRCSAALVLGGVQLCVEPVLLALELSDDIVLLLLHGLEVALLALEPLARLPELRGGIVVACIQIIEPNGAASGVHRRRVAREQRHHRRS